jgi:hypothetical protein
MLGDPSQFVTVHRRGEVLTDEDGHPLRDEDDEPLRVPDEEFEVYAHRVGPRRSYKLVEGRQTLVVGAAGVFPPGADLRETDEITANGVRYRIVGLYPVTGLDPNTSHHLHADLEAAS